MAIGVDEQRGGGDDKAPRRNREDRSSPPPLLQHRPAIQFIAFVVVDDVFVEIFCALCVLTPGGASVAREELRRVVLH
uniref:Transmembrane protein n=1 Tax=Steinernema glaseri TaxID=37863 RepID=A0A1I7YQL2_9BILA